MAFPSNIPIVPGHVLICPVRCLATVDQLSDEEWSAIREMLLKIKNALKEAVGAVGFNCAWNEGELAGQSVNHLHLHVVPRKEDDAGITEYEPRKYLYWPGHRNLTPEADLQNMAELIRENID